MRATTRSARRKQPTGPPLVVWDFDWSLINENSDTWVLEQLLGPSKSEQLITQHRNRGWTQLMDMALGEVHAAGHSAEDIRGSLRRIPIHPGALEAVRAARTAGAEQRILSDANTVYIDAVLDDQQLCSAFAEVATNPARYEESGQLRVRAHQPPGAPHGCELCPSNLCKGAVLDAWLAALAPSRCVYVGDGSGDFCPATRLRAGDVLLARQPPHDALLKLCRARPDAIQATVIEWGGVSDDGALALAQGMRSALQGLQGNQHSSSTGTHIV